MGIGGLANKKYLHPPTSNHIHPLWMDVGGLGWTWVDVRKKKFLVGSENFFLWVDMGEHSRWALVDVQTKTTYIHRRPTTSTHCGWTWVDMGGLGWTCVDLGGRGWTWVDVDSFGLGRFHLRLG